LRLFVDFLISISLSQAFFHARRKFRREAQRDANEINHLEFRLTATLPRADQGANRVADFKPDF
jgi:hypothetical protein